MKLTTKSVNLLFFRGKNLPVIAITSLIVFFSSCVTQRNVEYLNFKKKGTKEFTEAKTDEYRLKAGDELYIQISSLDDAALNVFSSASAMQSLYMGSINPYGASLISHHINKEGYLQLPVLGKILVTDKTLTQVSGILEDSLEFILNEPVVSVKLVNRYISVLGEVRNPGHYAFSQDKLSVYDALGLAGDITDYGNRTRVILTRNENGKNFCVDLDLTEPDILASEYYYVQPNDMIYVKPLRKRVWGMREFPYAVIISTITTGILLYSVF